MNKTYKIYKTPLLGRILYYYLNFHMRYVKIKKRQYAETSEIQDILYGV